MPSVADDLPILSFASGEELWKWLAANHAQSPGMWLRIFRKKAKVPSVAFEEVLDAGLCFGWSESARRSYDEVSYLQRFTPRRTIGTQSPRNLARAQQLITDGRMTAAGLKALGLESST